MDIGGTCRCRGLWSIMPLSRSARTTFLQRRSHHLPPRVAVATGRIRDTPGRMCPRHEPCSGLGVCASARYRAYMPRPVRGGGGNNASCRAHAAVLRYQPHFVSSRSSAEDASLFLPCSFFPAARFACNKRAGLRGPAARRVWGCWLCMVLSARGLALWALLLQVGKVYLARHTCYENMQRCDQGMRSRVGRARRGGTVLVCVFAAACCLAAPEA